MKVRHTRKFGRKKFANDKIMCVCMCYACDDVTRDSSGILEVCIVCVFSICVPYSTSFHARISFNSIYSKISVMNERIIPIRNEHTESIHIKIVIRYSHYKNK